ncbi:hypothetical protein [Nocardioides sp. cx-173]|uniref:hypothetical protein n=1 Tax=Nocardioides sp. cx-173 TaxID=2898796 RepID=UPI001E3F1286|nr:hypothetical protein [Nocardioides sp. cx-173]MCD4523674.1 hypothetical protein [Nocardioides sp. cx-173]UGB41996.1 hypothetical protein LQ940_00310 [Nocardioides sp. cx-173]
MSRRTKSLLLLAVVALLVNLPIAHSTWTGWRVDRDGEDVRATVTGTQLVADDGGYLVEFQMPEDIDPDESVWVAQVDRATYDEAIASAQIGVRVLRDDPSAYTVEGQVTSRVGLVVMGLVDLLLILAAVLLWRGRGRAGHALVLRATADVERTRPGPGIEKQHDGQYVVSGDVVSLEADRIVLDVEGREVTVLLEGHRNPVGYQQPARATGHLVG